MGITSSSPTGRPEVRTEAVEVTTTRAGWHRKRRRPFFWSAPGSSPASVRTWKPLQMPTTGPPGRAKRRHGLHDRRKAGQGTRAQVVAVGEAAGQDHRVDLAQAGVAVPEQHALGPGRLGRLHHVVLAVGAGEDDDADARRQVRSPRARASSAR